MPPLGSAMRVRRGLRGKARYRHRVYWGKLEETNHETSTSAPPDVHRLNPIAIIARKSARPIVQGWRGSNSAGRIIKMSPPAPRSGVGEPRRHGRAKGQIVLFAPC
jgi:hypothetical protein